MAPEGLITEPARGSRGRRLTPMPETGNQVLDDWICGLAVAQPGATLLVLAFLVFSMLRLIPGDPAMVLAGAEATPEIVAAIRDDLGLAFQGTLASP